MTLASDTRVRNEGAKKDESQQQAWPEESMRASPVHHAAAQHTAAAA